jgi:hypothetical protein
VSNSFSPSGMKDTKNSKGHEGICSFWGFEPFVFFMPKGEKE